MDGAKDALAVLNGHDLVEAHGLQDGVALADGLAQILGGVGVGADGDELAALIFAGHVVEHSRVIDEGVQLPAGRGMKGRVSPTQMPRCPTQSPANS